MEHGCHPIALAAAAATAASGAQGINLTLTARPIRRSSMPSRVAARRSTVSGWQPSCSASSARVSQGSAVSRCSIHPAQLAHLCEHRRDCIGDELAESGIDVSHGGP